MLCSWHDGDKRVGELLRVKPHEGRHPACIPLLLRLETLAGTHQVAADADELLRFLQGRQIEQGNLDVAVLLLYAVLQLVAQLRNAALDGVAFHEQFVYLPQYQLLQKV